MTLITKDFTFSAGAVITASEHNANFDEIYNDYNGSITNANISATAAIVDTKLAQITTASKVTLGALTVASEAQGDVTYRNASAWTRLGAGTAGQALTTAGAAANPSFAGMTTQGDIEYHNGTTRTRLAAGTSGQFLKTQGAGANPVWAAATVTVKQVFFIECGVVSGATRYFGVSDAFTANDADNASAAVPFPIAGTLKNLYLHIFSSTAGTISATVVLNGSDQALTASSAATTSTTVSDTSNTVAIAAGDIVSIKLVNGKAILNWSHVGLEFDPT